MRQGGNFSSSQENLIKLQRLSCKDFQKSTDSLALYMLSEKVSDRDRKSSDSPNSPPWDSLARHRAPPGVNWTIIDHGMPLKGGSEVPPT